MKGFYLSWRSMILPFLFLLGVAPTKNIEELGWYKYFLLKHAKGQKIKKKKEKEVKQNGINIYWKLEGLACTI